MDWHDLEKQKVDDLRALAKEKTSLEGVSALHKEELVEKIAAELGIERPHKVVDSSEKFEIKQRIRSLKEEKRSALEAGDRVRHKRILRRIHSARRRLRRMAHVT